MDIRTHLALNIEINRSIHYTWNDHKNPYSKILKLELTIKFIFYEAKIKICALHCFFFVSDHMNFAGQYLKNRFKKIFKGTFDTIFGSRNKIGTFYKVCDKKS